jgi:3-dehydroquinate synthase
MEDLLVLDFTVNSHKGPYNIKFVAAEVNALKELGTHFLVDKNVFSADLFPNAVAIDAQEENKDYYAIGRVMEQLLELKLKRDSVLVAIGGGITQDIACFIATTWMRGLQWKLVPTTLLAQADSCIGSKSSINFGKVKNLLGSFTPPNEVVINEQFLHTLDPKDIDSGIGEIIKLFIIDGQQVVYENIRTNLHSAVYQALQIKKQYIEQDEFDKGPRQILNYGHCFGHAIESVTNYAIPHGIAVAMGMNVANKLALDEGLITSDQFNSWRQELAKIYKNFVNVPVDIDAVLSAMTNDKKNTSTKINIVLPAGSKIVKQGFDASPEFWLKCKNALISRNF